jgi:hypothetical protein
MSTLIAACLLLAAVDVAPAIRDIHEAVASFRALLTEEQIAKGFFPFEDPKREDWHYVPRERAGLSFHDFTPAQEQAALGILRAALSAGGYDTVDTIRRLENVLQALENNPGRDAKYYHFAVFGTPEPGGTWGVRFEGHHLSLHWTIVGGKVIASEPQFLGSNPGEVASGEMKGTRPLGKSEDLGRLLVTALDETQRKTAVINDTAPADILSGNAREAIITEHLGIGWKELNPEQQGILMSILEEMAGVQRPELAAARLERLRGAGLDAIKFAWLGGLAKGEKHYYRIQGSTFLFEYDNTQGNANHIHTVWRDFNGDFGHDLLKEHYEDHADHEHPHEHDH